MAVLLGRVHFTELVEAAMHDGALAGLYEVRKTLETRRTAVIMKCRADLDQNMRRQYNTQQTLLKEQLDLVSDMLTADDAAAIWKNEMRFYVQADGSVKCKCGEHEIIVGDNFPSAHMLVCTPLTRQARAKIVAAMATGRPYVAKGPAGTGKTETIKDTTNMLGIEACVINSADDMKELPDEALAAARRGAVLIFDEFNRIGEDHMQTVIEAAAANAFTCATFNPGYRGRAEVPESIMHKCVVQEMWAPDFEVIAQVMLGCEGIADADNLGARLMRAVEACKAKMSKAHHYDFGMRYVKNCMHLIGHAARARGYDDETQLVADCLAASLFVRSTARDKDVALAEIAAAFGVSPRVAESVKGGTLEAFGRMVRDAAAVRHGVCVVGAADVDAAIAAVDGAMGARGVVVEAEGAALFGSWSEAGEWTDGPFTAALSAARSEARAVNIYVKAALSGESLAVLNSVLDDNKKLCLPNGRVLPMAPNTRVVLFDRDCSGWCPHPPPARMSTHTSTHMSAHHRSPAAVSRVATVLCDAAAGASSALPAGGAFPLKLCLGGDIHRVPVGDAALSFAQLTDVIARTFGGRLLNGFAVWYKDDEDDAVAVSTDAELSEAFRLMKSLKRSSLRLNVQPEQ